MLYTKSIKKLALASLSVSLLSMATHTSATPNINTIKTVVADLASDAYNGRASYTLENEATRNVLINKLISLDVAPAGTTPNNSYSGYLQTFQTSKGTLANIVGVIYPPGTQGQAPSVLLSAHYDGILQGAFVGQCDNIDPVNYPIPRPGFSSICNAAVDNMTGVAAIIAIVEDIANRISSPVAIAFWDGEEEDLLGSGYFANNPTFATNNLQLHVNLEALGYDAFPGMENHVSILGAHSGGSNLRGDIDTALASTSLDPQHTHLALAQFRTDVQPFLSVMQVPYLVFTNGAVSVYHSSADQFLDKPRDPVNIAKVHQTAIAVADLVETVSESNRNYSYQGVTYETYGADIYMHPPYSVNQDLLDYIDTAHSGLHYWYDRDVRSDLQDLRDQVSGNMGFLARYRWNTNYQGGFNLSRVITPNLFQISRLYTLNKVNQGEYDNQ